MNLTTEQQNVVDARNCSLLVAAAAGSGKTAVLVQRIITRILEGSVRLDHLLIVTFTRAAAAEMRERIGKAIAERLKSEPDNEMLKEQAACLQNAEICTIDSFCMSVVRENFQTLSIDPGFTLADEHELDLLKEDVLTEMMEEEYGKEDNADFLTFMKSYTDFKNDGEAKKMILKLYGFAESDPRPEMWLDKALSDYSKPLSASDFFKDIEADTIATLEDCIYMCDAGSALANSPLGPDKYDVAYNSDKNEFISSIQKIKNGAEFDKIKEILESINFIKLPTISAKDKESGKYDGDKAERGKKLRDTYKKVVGEKLINTYYFAPLEKMDLVYSKTAPAIGTLIRLTKEFYERFAAAKRDRNAYGFSDIAHFAHQILCVRDENGNEIPSEVALEKAANYDEIMIDEYQDSSYLQEYTLRAISGEFGGRIPNLFMVGDVKQSIYGFREARPELFNYKYETFAPYAERTEHSRIDLSMNFRSRKCVLDSVNVLLAPVMRKNIADIEYDSAAALHFGSKAYTEDTSDYTTELMLLDKEVTEEEAEQIEEVISFYSAVDSEKDEVLEAAKTGEIQREALAIGKKIKQMMEQGFQVKDKPGPNDKKRTRNVDFGDFAILLRANKNYSDVFTKTLNLLGIPSVANTGSGFFEAVEVKKILAMLRILDNPYVDIPFAAVMHSYFGDFTTEDMALIRVRYGASEQKRKQKMLYEAVRLAALDTEKNELTCKAERFIRNYEELRDSIKSRTVHEVIELIADKTGYRDFVTTLPFGERRRGNIDILISLAVKYEKSTYTGIREFLRYVDRLCADNKDFGEASTEVSENAVIITTIHKSKGLEFPVVFLAGMGKQFNEMDSRDKLIFHKDYGIGSNYVNVKQRKKGKTLKQIYLQKKKNQENKAEELRLLYVALTRAEEKLILVGSVKEPEAAIKKWKDVTLAGEAFTKTAFEGAKTYLDFVAPTIFKSMGEGVTCGQVHVENCSGTELFGTDFLVERVDFYEAEAFKALYGENTPVEAKEEQVSYLDIPGVKEELEAQNAYSYPFAEKAKAPMRVSVSDLKHIEIEALMKEPKALEEEPVHIIPEFLKEEEATDGAKGALRGTLYHEVFEKLQYNGDYSTAELAEESVKKDVNELIEGQFLEGDILSTVSIKTLTAFCLSNIGQRFAKAEREGRLHREQPFVYGLSNEEYRFYSKSEADTEMVMVQGIIDAYIDEGDSLTLVDYKTDKVWKNPEKELSDKYHVQLDLYAKALEKLTGKPVKEKIIYSVTANKEILLQ